MSKVIEVKFLAQQGAEDLFVRASGPRKVYIRQPLPGVDRVVWLTATKCNAGYEADSPLKAGITVRVIKGKRNSKEVLFEEKMEAESGCTPSASKEDFFSYEQLKNAAKEIAKRLGLHTYDSWAKWLLNERTRFNYDGYADNWLHFGTKPGSTTAEDPIEIVGVTHSVFVTEWKHLVCDKTWTVVEIRDNKGNTLELCGYGFNA